MNEAPGIERTGYTPGLPPLFHSRAEIALIKDKSAHAGFGYLKRGRVMATTVADELVVPVPVDSGSVDAIDAARSRLVVDAGDTDTTVTVSEADAAKFRVGDEVVLNNLTPVYQDLGAITKIAAPANGQVVITVTNAVSGALMTVASRSALSHKTAAASPFYAASCVLDKDINTGTAGTDNAVPVSVVFGNCILYTAFLTGMSAKSLTDLGAIQDGVHTIIK
jgi:hypothetical protein